MTLCFYLSLFKLLGKCVVVFYSPKPAAGDWAKGGFFVKNALFKDIF